MIVKLVSTRSAIHETISRLQRNVQSNKLCSEHDIDKFLFYLHALNNFRRTINSRIKPISSDTLPFLYLFFPDACHPYEPFKCPSDGNCISIQYLCDGAPDCSDGYDEDMRLCTAGNLRRFNNFYVISRRLNKSSRDSFMSCFRLVSFMFSVAFCTKGNNMILVGKKLT